ncbi:ATP-dependent Clp protease proteolytic subunit [Frankia sp. R82]|uniref:ATP-dependent Clp protease proteolytic subunit n=1 Tax=Frankia sp. R82 TaxID=2950553 RepID=UPI002043A48B|nr:ATP-dependent Clp protease proteolytic subunit [Frankia sp. R82]MCM3884566.1 ATP-dependent Clp protease proteolytic subunit [Frankia sp. R82]
MDVSGVDVSGVDPLDEDDPRTVGPYNLLGRLGEGGMGTAYLARHGEGGRYVALKMVRRDLARVPKFRERLLWEAHAAQRVARFCTAEVLDVSVQDRRPYLVTEFIDGPTLDTAVWERGPLPTADLERLAVAVASALTAIHAGGVVHRDLKPGNILLSSSGARVVDFGIAHALDATTTLTHSNSGTPAFMAPEQALGTPATAAADIYAWGGVILFAGTGRLPHGTGAIPVILYRAIHEDPDLTGLDISLRSLVERALRKNPAERPTAHDLFLGLVRGRPAAVTSTPTPARLSRSAPPAEDREAPEERKLVGRSGRGPWNRSASRVAEQPNGGTRSYDAEQDGERTTVPSGDSSGGEGKSESVGTGTAAMRRLLRDRIIFIGTAVEEETAERVCAELLMLDAEEPHRDIFLYINSPGGSVPAAMSIYDTMQFVQADVTTLVLGLAAGTAQLLLTAGTPGKRCALPFARVLMCGPTAGASDPDHSAAIEEEDLLYTKRVIRDIFCRHIGQPVERIAEDLNRNRWFTAKEARDYGMIDNIVVKSST